MANTVKTCFFESKFATPYNTNIPKNPRRHPTALLRLTKKERAKISERQHKISLSQSHSQYLLDQLLVVMRQQLRIDLTNEFHDHTNHDNKTGAGDNKVLWSKVGELGEEQWYDSHNTEERSTPEVEAIAHTRKKASRLFARASAWDESTTLLNAFGDFFGLKGDRHVEVREAKD